MVVFKTSKLGYKKILSNLCVCVGGGGGGGLFLLHHGQYFQGRQPLIKGSEASPPFVAFTVGTNA